MNMRSLVSLEHVGSYDPHAVLEAVRACLRPLGGMDAFVRPGQKVLLKPNLLGPFAVHKAVTTHPAIVRAAILLAQEAGGRVFVGDSPGVGSLALAAKTSGLTSVLEETGAVLAEFSTPMDFEAPQNRVAKRLTLAKAVSDADVIITLPKLKTHGQMTFTGALKNQYGLIPGALKSQWHFRLQRKEWLAALILDIHCTARPALAIMDAIVAMEGKGPSGGRPRLLGAVLASRDLLAVDTLACLLIDLEPRFVPVLEAARGQGIGATTLAELEIVGEDWRTLRVPDFEKVSKLEDLLRIVPLPKPMLNWVREQWTARPRIVDGRCTECGVCEDGCPVSPSAIHPQAPPDRQVDDEACIRCYCCHEFCPQQAIALEHSLLARCLRLQPLTEGIRSLVSRLWPRRGRAGSQRQS
jgi:uncharacterized protein (DUF362 family)/NAD-dependent dihydropyrimidine dehydrogenase PreA subunit